ncbi:Cyclic nucleotide binding domain [Trypanosoma vivax]|uniref:Cyclic nucleotide-binding domain-containing protein n=1 Tax=Trypanosoma vivax (strain Y486) TaxID=1055687 RepID=G0U0F5_TRYVY|nr:Cyclic nucleotide binding domain [Trypanosoma vivax]CCC49553.1 conserved hypothetical protein [Trypanosoma vivax Y486]
MQGSFVPDQNQLYALYIYACGVHRVGKPNKEMLMLLAEDDRAWESRVTKEAKERGITVEDLREMEGDTEEQRKQRYRMVPLAFRRVLRLVPQQPTGATQSAISCEGLSSSDIEPAAGSVHIGARGVLAILDVVRELPFLEVLDLSNLTSIFLADRYQSNGVQGNHAIEALCQMAVKHPSLRAIDLRGQPLGTRGAHYLLDMLRGNKGIQEVLYDTGAVAPHLVKAIRKQQEINAATPRSPSKLTMEPSPVMKMLRTVDRKTLREQQLLRRLIESEIALGDILSYDDVSMAVLHARVMSTTETLTRSRGLCGDGVHLFLLKSGVLRSAVVARGFELRRGDFFGESYDGILFSQNLLEEVERGVVYAIPLEYCGPLLKVWSKRVEAVYSKLKYNTILQAVDTWTKLRICTCTSAVTFDEGDVVIRRGDAFKGLFLVTSGVFSVVVSRKGVASIKHEFTAGDIFGEEALLVRRECSSVNIVAGSTILKIQKTVNESNNVGGGVEEPPARSEKDDEKDEDEEDAVVAEEGAINVVGVEEMHEAANSIEKGEGGTAFSCLLIRGCAARVLSSHLRPVFRTLAAVYSRHEELQPLGK